MQKSLNKLIKFILIVIILNPTNILMAAFWGSNFGQYTRSQSTEWTLRESDIPTNPELITINGKNLENIFDITERNIQALYTKIDEWRRYIAGIENRIVELEKDKKKNNLHIVKSRMENYRKKVEALEQEIVNQQELRKAALAQITDIKATEAKTEIMAEENDKNRDNEIKKVQEGIKTFINETLKKENLEKTGIFAALTTAGITAAYYGSKLGFNLLQAYINQPTLIRESNKLGLKQNLKQFWNHKILSKPIIEAKIEEVILSPDHKTSLSNFAYDTKRTHENRLNFRNALFYGEPGTGKTMFAKRLAKYCNMDYAILSGADFSQFKDGKDIEELHKFFDWAQHSKQGLIVFIDEADSFLRKRKDLTNKAINLINAFLSRTGESSNKIMFIFATNHPEILDPAVMSRIHSKINFPAPETNERKQILDLYLEKYIKNDTKTVKINGQKTTRQIYMQPEIDSNFINHLAQKTDGFSGRDLSQTVLDMQISAYNRGNDVLTKEMAEQAIDQKIREARELKDMYAS